MGGPCCGRVHPDPGLAGFVQVGFEVLSVPPEDSVTCEVAVSRVTFAEMSRADIDWYVDTGEGADKAGSYALQGIGALFVTAKARTD